MGRPKVAFICVHNSCRSQIAEALGRHLAADVFESCSSGTERKERIDPDAVRLMKENGVAVNDLYAVAVALDPQAHSDATHFETEAGTEALAQAVSKSILAVI